ncbi:DUF1016 N-terminal domain-containing protein [Dyadobacter sp. 32]|uniref:DUF1016 N-terminal domain-containing protein n=1 Tax=Dyadobacter sp. 32 TaxID=538966 RepID=UPI0011ED9F92
MNVELQFGGVKRLIVSARNKTVQLANASLIELYWNIGAYVSQKVAANEWGKSVVVELALYIQKSEPGIQGFSERNIWRMKQFYETYTNQDQLLPLLQELKMIDRDKIIKLSALPTVLDDHDRWDKKILTALLTEISWSANINTNKERGYDLDGKNQVKVDKMHEYCDAELVGMLNSSFNKPLQFFTELNRN